MTQNKINFLIDHIDPLGQGVFKKGEDIYFIPKTLINESGSASIYKKNKKINFAKLESLETISDNRIQASCPHYEECNGCHYLHTDYDNEISLKTQTIKRMSSYDYPNSEILSFKAPRRERYRNRIQLHYNLKHKKIGFIDPSRKKIIDVSSCFMPTEELFIAYQGFLKNWYKEAKKQKLNSGHVELYIKDDKLSVTWNQRYSQGGFTQVFKEMNLKLNEIVKDHLFESNSALDLFGGDGNLSQSIQNRSIIDYYQKIDHQDKFHLDLYNENSLELFKNQNTKKFDTFIVDPPRKGFPLLDTWVEFYQPKKIIYVSCHSATMFRDIKKLKSSYKMEKIYMLDLFPSTHHFEGLTILSRK